MPRTFLAAPLFALLLCPPLGAETPKLPADIAWADAAHKPYFNYQDYLAKLKLDAESKDSWAKLKPAERVTKVSEGETQLKARLETLLSREYLSPRDKEFLEAVWGKAVADKAELVTTARQLSDPSKVKKALEDVSSLAKKIGDVNVDWGKLFDKAKKGGSLSFDLDSRPVVVPATDEKLEDYTKVKPSQDFLASLASKDVTDKLATAKAFADYLEEKKVPDEARPGLLAMYQVLSLAKGDDQKQLAHLLPTVVHFLGEGKKISVETIKGAYGQADGDDYDRPARVTLDQTLVKEADPLIAGKTLAHEFQHIYDMYVGRHYSLDSELRGFKVHVHYLRTLKASKPDKYKELADNKQDLTRQIMADAIETEKAYSQGPDAYRAQVALGHHYNKWDAGTFVGRVSLRETLAPTGAPRDLAETEFLLKWAKARVTELETAQAELRVKLRAGPPSREVDERLERLTKDLADARENAAGYDKTVTIKAMRLGRMRAEAAWLDKKYAGQKTPPPFDLDLPVDSGYYKK